MARTVAIGIQDFADLRKENYFYIDKTNFIREWWESGNSVTLITRPRRFGKTLNINMLEKFFSVNYANRTDLFEGLSIWKYEEYRQLQGTYPVINLSFANVKENNYTTARQRINLILTNLYSKFAFLRKSDILTEEDRDFLKRISVDMNDNDAAMALHQLSKFLYQYYGKKVIILLDEYDTPMQEAYVCGFWEEMVSFIRSLFNSTFKTNEYLARALMTGITRVSKESIFSDLNHLKVVTTTSDDYATSFGFTEEEVFAALEEYGLSQEKKKVKEWYNGFLFGTHTDIYNPWSIINFLDTKKYDSYWANTSSNSLVSKLLREGNKNTKLIFEALLRGESVSCMVDEQIVYSALDGNETAIWSLLLASGYLKVKEKETEKIAGKKLKYKLCLTNGEVLDMFYCMVHDWFGWSEGNYNDFIRAMFRDDIEEMNAYMNRVTRDVFSYFDTGKNVEAEPERFYHGFVLGLMIDLMGEYVLTSNRESGFGRYDVMLEPVDKSKNAMILEFKVHNKRKESSLEETVATALEQIEEKQYEASLIAKGFKKEQIHCYGFAFEGKNVLIGSREE